MQHGNLTHNNGRSTLDSLFISITLRYVKHVGPNCFCSLTSVYTNTAMAKKSNLLIVIIFIKFILFLVLPKRFTTLNVYRIITVASSFVENCLFLGMRRVLAALFANN